MVFYYLLKVIECFLITIKIVKNIAINLNLFQQLIMIILLL